MIPCTFSRRRALPLFIVTAAVAAPASARAAVIPFGTNLDAVPANSDPAKTCDSGPWWFQDEGVLIPIELGSSQLGSCLVTHGGLDGTTTFGLAAPATGTATAARVKIGAITGRMRINVVRSKWEEQDGQPAAWSLPYLQAYGPTFRPTADAVTTVPLNLPLRVQTSVTSKDPVYDSLTLEVLSGDVPVPLSEVADDTPFFAAYAGPTGYSLPAPSEQTFGSFGQTGLAVTMNADLTTPPAPGSSTPTPTPAAGLPTPTPRPSAAAAETLNPSSGAGSANVVTAVLEPSVSLLAKTVRLSSGRAPVDLRCSDADCTGRITLLHRTGRGEDAPTESVGTADFAIKAGSVGRVSVKLNARGKLLLTTKRVLQLQARVSLRASPATTTLRFRLRR